MLSAYAHLVIIFYTLIVRIELFKLDLVLLFKQARGDGKAGEAGGDKFLSLKMDYKSGFSSITIF
jgi:hypothetical protein